MDLSAYLRFSPGGEDSQSLDLQREAITEWAKSEGHTITSWHQDEGISGGEDISVRVGLFAAIESVRSGMSGGIVVRELARFARDQIAQEVMFRDVRSIGGRVFSTKASENMLLDDDGSDPGRELVRGIFGLVAQYERKVIVARMAAGRRMAGAHGKFAFGSPQYGMVSAEHPSGKGSVLVPVPSEQAAIQRMQELRSGGATLQAIADTLHAEGVPTKQGGRWRPGTVARALERAEAAATA
jgi:DNA invertase Pin-like site-specific DNA recombinase